MKISALLLLSVAALLAGCETDVPRKEARENPIQRGLRGEGAITPLDRGDDPYVR